MSSNISPTNESEYYRTNTPYDAHISPRPSPPASSASASSLQQSQQQRPPSPSRVGNERRDNAYPGVALAAAPMNQQPPSIPLPPQRLPMQMQPPPGQLPLGAVPFNGGVLFHANLFANSYRVPGPNGESYVYYDNSVPCPPAIHGPDGGPPTLRGQWNQLTKWLKAFIILLAAFWLLQWIVHWQVALFLPIVFFPTYLLWRQWKKHYECVELYMIVKLYATAFVPGALIVMLVESAVTVLFAFICFQSALSGLFSPGQTPAPTDPKGGGNNEDPDTPPGMEFLKIGESPALFIFLFLLSFGSAGCVEESLKYWCTNRVKKYRPTYKVIKGYELYAIASALGFSTMENIGYVLSGAFSPGGGGSSMLGIFLNTIGRTFISTPLHLMTGYLIGLMVIRRDILGESLRLYRVMGWSIFWHGTFDFGLFVIMVLQHHWSNDESDDAVSYILMACIVIICYTGLAARIYTVRRKVFHRIESPEDHEQQQPAMAVGGAAGDLDAEHAGADEVHQPAQVGSINGFTRLQQAVDASV
jgi:RsiW-degrading membrane proteinase PrsW (M82 family)